jgi:hypothetical protein
MYRDRRRLEDMGTAEYARQEERNLIEIIELLDDPQ